MKKLSLVLLLWLCACCLVFGQVNSARRALFNEANGTVGKRVPSGWKEWEGLFWKSTDIAIGKDYTALQVKGNIVELAMVGCLFANYNAQTRWLKESYDTLVADRWEILSNTVDDWVLKKGDILATNETSSTDDGTLTAAVVFMSVSTALGGSTGSTTWTAVSNIRIGTSEPLGAGAIAYGNNRFVAVGLEMATSTDGKAWTAVDVRRIFGTADYGFITAIAYGSNRFVAGCSEGKMATSTNGTAWAAVDVGRILTGAIGTIAYGNNRFFAVGYECMATSTNGTAWTAVDVSRIFGGSSINAIAYGNNRFVAVGDNGKMATSTNGTAWTAVSNSRFGTSSICAIAYGSNRFVASSFDGKMAVSTDGTTWTTVDVSRIFGGSSIYAIAYGNNRFVAVGDNGKMATSTDGITWTAIDVSRIFGSNGICAVAYGNNRFVAVGYGDYVAYLPD